MRNSSQREHNRQGEEKGVLDIHTHQIRDYTKNRQKQVDDYPYGGGMGMVMTAQPIADCFRAVCEMAGTRPRLIYMSPQGQVLTQKKRGSRKAPRNLHTLRALRRCGPAGNRRICGRGNLNRRLCGYRRRAAGSGADRLHCPHGAGVLSDEQCFTEESHYSGLLEYPHYTRPAEWEGRAVPEILLTGNHAKIAQWRREQALKRTYSLRPDLLEHADLSVSDLEFLENLKSGDCKT